MVINVTTASQQSSYVEDNTVHLAQLPDQLKREAVSQIIYNKVKEDPSHAQIGPDALAKIYNVIHMIDFNRYMDGILKKDQNIISLMVIEISNALETIGVIVEKDEITRQFI
jgi:hypothetical protein